MILRVTQLTNLLAENFESKKLVSDFALARAVDMHPVNCSNPKSSKGQCSDDVGVSKFLENIGREQQLIYFS